LCRHKMIPHFMCTSSLILNLYNILCTVNTQYTSSQGAIIKIRLYLATCFGCKRPSSGKLRTVLRYSVQYNIIIKTGPEDGRNYRPKHVELIEIINKITIVASNWLFISFYQWCAVTQTSKWHKTLRRT
jgi:hypothetical protein